MVKTLSYRVLLIAAVAAALAAPTAQAASLSLNCRTGYGKLGETPTFKLPVPPAPPIYVVTNPAGHSLHDNKKAGAPATWVKNPTVPAGARINITGTRKPSGDKTNYAGPVSREFVNPGDIAAGKASTFGPRPDGLDQCQATATW
jgi:hypothetical protein